MIRDRRRFGGIVCATRQLLRERSGVGAIEFALVAPVLILLYVGSAEVSVSLTINKKVARAASTVADLVTQKSCVPTSYLNSMVDAANAIMSPYNESPIKMKITEIHIDGSGDASVAWSWDQSDGTPYTTNGHADIPADLAVPDTDLLRAELSFVHSLFMPGADGLDINKLTMSKTYYLRPRGEKPIEFNTGDCSSS